MTIYLITKDGFGVEVQIQEKELEILKQRLKQGDMVAEVEVYED